MNPPPVPFGDPAQIQKERSSAVGKGIAFGCGGCALLVLASLVFLTGIAAVAFAFIRNTEPVKASLAAARSSIELKQAVGEPIEMGWLVTGSFRSENNQTEAEVTFPVAGPRGQASIHAVGKRAGSAKWQFSEMNATVDLTGQVIELRPR